jgi:glutamate synthase (NADPH/NADH) large chain
MTGGIVVILGPVGRNFAAGMSGGIAYVYDPDDRLDAQCNRSGLEIERIEPGEDADADLGDLLRFDAERLKALVEAHEAAAGSARARALLAEWPQALRHFAKIVPIEYRRALLEARVAAGDGFDAHAEASMTVAAE